MSLFKCKPVARNCWLEWCIYVLICSGKFCWVPHDIIYIFLIWFLEFYLWSCVCGVTVWCHNIWMMCDDNFFYSKQRFISIWTKQVKLAWYLMRTLIVAVISWYSDIVGNLFQVLICFVCLLQCLTKALHMLTVIVISV